MSAEKHTEMVIEKNVFIDLIRSLANDNNILVPEVDGAERFVQLRSVAEASLNFSHTKIPPKEILLPHTETLVEYDAHGSPVQKPQADRVPNRKTILVGVRPCDAHAISLLDRIFIESAPVDPYYQKRRADLTVIAFACSRPADTCFCTSVGGGPDSEKGADLLVFELTDRYVIKVITDRGRSLMKCVKESLVPPTKNDDEEKTQLVHNARKCLSNNIDTRKLQKKLEQFDAGYWDTLHQKCLGCGVCTFLCPTCHCFDITDENTTSGGRRIRTWDSCMFPLFTLHASGHNPRPTYKERMRQRIMHKFCYSIEQYGHILCVGCGRCVSYCPVHLDIRKVVESIQEGA